MNIREGISSATKINGNQPQHEQWVQKPKTKLPPPPREKGVSPYYNNLCNDENLSRGNGKDCKVEYNFSEIVPSVREVSGGYNVQSNEVIEKRFKEQQKKYNQNVDDANSSATYTTASSATVDSYKTALQDWTLPSQLDDESGSSIVINKNRIKKNALIRTLVEQNQVFPDDNEDISTISSDSFYDAPASESDISIDIENLNINEDQDTMRQLRVGLWFQSSEDPDVYNHVLQEEIKNDPVWQKQRLRRKGEEVVYTPRQYYLSFSDDDFGFVSPKQKS